jgi:hypothetical protein
MSLGKLTGFRRKWKGRDKRKELGSCEMEKDNENWETHSHS